MSVWKNNKEIRDYQSWTGRFRKEKIELLNLWKSIIVKRKDLMDWFGRRKKPREERIKGGEGGGGAGWNFTVLEFQVEFYYNIPEEYIRDWKSQSLIKFHNW